MTGVPSPHPPEQLISALIPASLPRQRPLPMPAVELPAAPPPASTESSVVLSVGRVEGTGRIPAAAVVAALGWPPGTGLRAGATGRRIVLEVAVSDLATAAVTSRAQITVPVAVRRLAGIDAGSAVVLAAIVGQQVLVVHQAADVVRLLRRTHMRILGGRHDG